MLRFLRLFRLALWRGFEHDIFIVGRAAAYYSILTLFPALMVVASVLATSHTTQAFLVEVSRAAKAILPPATAAAVQRYLERPLEEPIGILVSASIITLFAASGVIVSWMEGFCRAYHLRRSWGIIQERLIALALVIAAFIPMTFATILVAFGSQVEDWMMSHTVTELGPAILMLWTMLRWAISMLTSIAVLALIYHFGVPRSQPWYSVLPGSTLSTLLWFAATQVFGWYVTRFATYNLIYGPLGAAIALLVWMYIISLVVLVGAEFNALIYPRSVLTTPQDETAAVPVARAH
ncbi:MAG: YihY/virulence factor BrkB family protein [Acidobacteriales bacterium]|nr:YihY/virulence factor BrkB family protein [Terriglobales bacterium]